MDSLSPLVIQFIAESSSKISFSVLKKHFRKTHKTNTNDLKAVVSDLIQSGELCYTDHYGSSFIEVSYNHPRKVSEHVVLKPPWCSWPVEPNQWVVSIERGASFGGGDHPSTRLAIQLIDTILHEPGFRKKKRSFRAIDIGTGSGVLAIVAAKLGVGTIWGVDTDPCAVFEARENVRLNQVEDRVHVLGDNLDAIDASYDLVFANLRAPTLYGFRELFEKKAEKDSLLIFSGLKSDETHSITEFYKKTGFLLFKERCENGWSAICLFRGDFLSEMSSPIVSY
jgi:ribosomal protein L11 methyltransferase